MRYRLLLAVSLCVLSIVTGVQPGLADDLMPAVTSPNVESAALPPGATHPDIRLTPDKSTIIRLDRDALSVIVGNPSHLNILLDTPRLLILVPRAPGATYFTVLDADGEVIMERHAVIAAPEQQYVRIRRSCANAGESTACRATSVYFCPDICHEVDVTQAEEDVTETEVPDEAPAASETEEATQDQP